MIVRTPNLPNNGDNGKDGSPEADSLEQIEVLIRRLVSRVKDKHEHVFEFHDECDHEEIIVDTDIDGVRYLLIRMPTSIRSVVSLSPREQEIARMVAKGFPNKTIGGILNISAWTVCTHLRRIFGKLGVNSRAAMIARLIEEGYVWEQIQPNGEPSSSETYGARRRVCGVSGT